VLFVGNLHPAVQRERLPWLGRLARLSERWKVVIATRVFGADYRGPLGRARVAFNRSLRGCLGRHRLALACLRRGAAAEAEAQWRAALAERPDFAEAWQGLQELQRRRGQGAGPPPGGGEGLAFSLTSDVPAMTFDPGCAAGDPPPPSGHSAEQG
jgi:hypothetical protein